MSLKLETLVYHKNAKSKLKRKFSISSQLCSSFILTNEG